MCLCAGRGGCLYTHGGNMHGRGRLVPLGKVLEAETQLVVVPVELGVLWDLSQKHLGHLQRALGGEGKGEVRGQGWGGASPVP